MSPQYVVAIFGMLIDNNVRVNQSNKGDVMTTQSDDQPILFTMRIKTADWDKLKQANDEVFGGLIDEARQAGLISSKVYRSEANPNDVLFVSEWRSHDSLHDFGDKHGDRFNEIAGVTGEDWEDVAWRLSDARVL